MASRALRFVSAFILLSLCGTVLSQNECPDMKQILFGFYQTEVQVTDVLQETSAYATEYYDSINGQGALKVYFQGNKMLFFYDNTSITTVEDYNCISWDKDISEYDYTPIYYGWLNQKPLILGPTAALWYASDRKKDCKKAPKPEDARAIKCDKYTLQVKDNKDDLNYTYYFAQSNWTTPYKYKNLVVPIRIVINGTSSRYAAEGMRAQVYQVYDFAYFKPSIDDFNNLLPPIGLGCKMRKTTDLMPDVPEAFMYTAEVVDLLEAEKKADVEIQTQWTWYDHSRLIARRDIYSRKKGYSSNLYDFNTGALYKIREDGVCSLATLRNTDFQKFDYGATSIMKSGKEVLNLNGNFYDMGTRTIRGLDCDTFESVEFDGHYKGKKYYKLVVTAYFTKSETNVAVKGETESRIPVYYIITGYDSPDNRTLQLQYNVFGFDDVVWPEMYNSFRLDRCYTKPDSKAYFVLIMPIPAKDAAKMEEKNDVVLSRLRTAIAINARVPEMRIPYLKADYKPSGVYVTGLMLERPPAILQFYDVNTGPTVIRDPDYKIAGNAETPEECAHACVDEKDFLCKGFWYCGKACFLRSTDLEDIPDTKTKSVDLGECTEYLRAEIESTNYRQNYLIDALGYLDQAVIDGNVTIMFEIKDGEEVVKVSELVVGEGPYIGDDTGDKPFSLDIEYRKLDDSLETVKVMEYVGSLHDCYKKCKEEGAACSSFSYCPDSPDDNKQCMVSLDLVVKGVTNDNDLIPDKNCNIYNLKYSDYFIPYPERVSLLAGDKVLNSISSLEKCALNCRREKDFTCRGFEYCKSKKICTLHKTHILDLKPGETGKNTGKACIHYAAQYIRDYMDLGDVLIDDNSNVVTGTTLEQCAQMCSEALKTDCNSFNFCDRNEQTFTESTCSLSKKMLRDSGVTTTSKTGCLHFEKRDSVHDWDNSKVKQLGTGYTKKGFAGLVVGMIALGIILGALGFVLYSFIRARSSGEEMAVRFMKT